MHDAYFFNAVAYDFYSIDELKSHSGPRSQWKTFPLPNEHIPMNITPWIPPLPVRDNMTSVSLPDTPQTATGLAFVDRIYIASAPNLTDRHVNLKRMLARYQITNYEWRMKWTRDTCNAPENEKEVYKKLNLYPETPTSKITFIFLTPSLAVNC